MLKEGLRMFEESIYWHVAILPGPFFFGPSGRRRRGGRHGRRRRRKATGTQHVWIPMKWDDHNHIPCLDPSTYVDIWWYLRVYIYIYTCSPSSICIIFGERGPRNDLPQRKRNQMQSRQVPKSRRRLVVRMPQNPKTRRMHLTSLTRTAIFGTFLVAGTCVLVCGWRSFPLFSHVLVPWSHSDCRRTRKRHWKLPAPQCQTLKRKCRLEDVGRPADHGGLANIRATGSGRASHW